MMKDQKFIRAKAGLLERAKLLGNVRTVSVILVFALVAACDDMQYGPPPDPYGNRAAANAALLNIGLQMMMLGQPQPVYYGPPPRMVTTNCYRAGSGMINCTSY